MVHSPNVATYVGDGEAVISWLLTGGVASGVLIFLLLSIWLLFCSVQKARSRGRLNSASKTTEAPNNGSNGHLLAENSRTASIEAIEAATFEEQQLRQTTAVARAQRNLTSAELNKENRPFPDLLDCHNYEQPPPPPFEQPPQVYHRLTANNGAPPLLLPRLFTPPPNSTIG